MNLILKNLLSTSTRDWATFHVDGKISPRRPVILIPILRRLDSINTVIGENADNTLTTGARNILVGRNIETTAAGTRDQLNIRKPLYRLVQNGYTIPRLAKGPDLT